MKQKDILLIVVIVVISSVLSFVTSNIIFATPKNRKQKVEVVAPISAQFSTPDKKYFNEQSINPTQLIRIGDNTNQTPFNQKN